MKRRLVVTGIIKCGDEYLVVKRSEKDVFLPGAWEFPGGNIEEGELLEDALKRELQEEIGFQLLETDLKIVNYFEKIKNKEKENYYYIEFDFLIPIKNKDINIILSDEHKGYAWVKADSKLLDEFIKNKINKVEVLYER